MPRKTENLAKMFELAMKLTGPSRFVIPAKYLSDNRSSLPNYDDIRKAMNQKGPLIIADPPLCDEKTERNIVSWCNANPVASIAEVKADIHRKTGWKTADECDPKDEIIAAMTDYRYRHSPPPSVAAIAKQATPSE